jgi:hypothetical protein
VGDDLPVIEIEPMPIAKRIELFRERVSDLADFALAAPHEVGDRDLLALSRTVLPAASGIEGIRRDDEPVVLGHLEAAELSDFVPIPAVQTPETEAYLLIDVDLGAESRNVTPEDALTAILAAGRSPLTLEEGIGLMLQQPGAIEKNWGFSMAGSRRGDQRVPAFWVSEGRPKLGWCWDRNPHTWLGTASCAERR